MTDELVDRDHEAPSVDTDSSFDAVLQKIARVPEESPDPPLPRIGQVVGGKYRIDARLGRGGMSVVFRATHLVSQKPVAIKWMLRSTSDGPCARFMREARIAGRIDHPNVVDVYDVGVDGSCRYLVMELLHGESLRTKLEEGPLDVRDAIVLLLPAMRGVSAVHQAGVIHRDLKPDNIFLCACPDGTPREAKVLDFGISAISGTDLSDPTLTSEGALLGTPGYMSPEQLQSARDVDAHADVYSLGVILYEALSGQLPFTAESFSALVLAITHDRPIPLSKHRPDVPRELERVVMRALARQPADRYASVEQLMAALTPFAAEQLYEVRARSSMPGGMSVPRRGRIVKGVAGILAAVGLATWVLATQQQDAAGSPQPPAAAAAGILEGAPEAPSSVEPTESPAALSPVPTETSMADVREQPRATPTQQSAASASEPRPERRKRAVPLRSSRLKDPAHAKKSVLPVQMPRSGHISIDQL